MVDALRETRHVVDRINRYRKIIRVGLRGPWCVTIIVSNDMERVRSKIILDAFVSQTRRIPQGRVDLVLGGGDRDGVSPICAGRDVTRNDAIRYRRVECHGPV